jgi:hypothetical protein
MIKSLRISFFFCTFAHQIDSNIIFFEYEANNYKNASIRLLV